MRLLKYDIFASINNFSLFCYFCHISVLYLHIRIVGNKITDSVWSLSLNTSKDIINFSQRIPFVLSLQKRLKHEIFWALLFNSRTEISLNVLRNTGSIYLLIFSKVNGLNCFHSFEIFFFNMIKVQRKKTSECDQNSFW